MSERRETPDADAAVPPLASIYCYLTEGCNLACRHCWLAPKHDPDGSRHAVLPVETFAKVIAEAIPLGLTTVKLTGGEPLLHPRFDEIVRIAADAKISVHVETNGMLCTPRKAAVIAAAPNAFASVSIDGADAGVHDWIRGATGLSTRLARRCATWLPPVSNRRS
jgi:MoaA/NifB/PqqE/SkfB family radical SAM enzyme